MRKWVQIKVNMRKYYAYVHIYIGKWVQTNNLLIQTIKKNVEMIMNLQPKSYLIFFIFYFYNLSHWSS